jgi:hypothetical protein
MFKPIFFTCVVAFLAALLEIQIEGEHGWAERLPTWRRRVGNAVITGYHVFLALTILVLFHAPYFLGRCALTWRDETTILAMLILFWVLEDSLWFFLNTRFRRLCTTKDTWRDPKFLGVPVLYLVLYVPILVLLSFSRNSKLWWSTLVLLSLVTVTTPFQVPRETI